MSDNKQIYESVITQMQIIQHKKGEISQDTLGRTLAYNNLLPRLSDMDYLYKNFRYTQDLVTRKGLIVELDNLIRFMQYAKIQDNTELEQEIACVFIDDSKSNQKECLMDYISILRRFLPVFVGYNGILIDTYQILEIAIAGADMCVLNCVFLRAYAEILLYIQDYNANDSVDIENVMTHICAIRDNVKQIKQYRRILHTIFNTLVAYMTNLGVTPIFYPNHIDDLKMLLQLKTPIDCVLVHPDLITLLPNSYIIFSNKNDIPLHKTLLNPQQYYGIDMVLEHVT